MTLKGEGKERGGGGGGHLDHCSPSPSLPATMTRLLPTLLLPLLLLPVCLPFRLPKGALTRQQFAEAVQQYVVASRQAVAERTALVATTSTGEGTATVERIASGERTATVQRTASGEMSASVERTASGEGTATVDRIASGEVTATVERISVGERTATGEIDPVVERTVKVGVIEAKVRPTVTTQVIRVMPQKGIHKSATPSNPLGVSSTSSTTRAKLVTSPATSFRTLPGPGLHILTPGVPAAKLSEATASNDNSTPTSLLQASSITLPVAPRPNTSLSLVQTSPSQHLDGGRCPPAQVEVSRPYSLWLKQG